jgi:hypothetical protein
MRMRRAGCRRRSNHKRPVAGDGVDAAAGLHQLLAPMLADLDRLGLPQREALRTVFGVSSGPRRARIA